MKMDFKGLLHKTGFIINQNSPQILIFTGIAGLITSGVIAVLATKNKLPDIQEKHEEKMNEILAASEETPEKKDIQKEKGRYAIDIAKLYGPSIILAAASIGCILKGNDIMQKRSMALAAAYATLDNAYQEYRKRIIEKYGEDVDKELRYDGRQQKIEVVETDEEGKEKKVKKNAFVAGPGLSGYARYFAYGETTAAEPSIDYNKMFLQGMQKTFNKMLKIKYVVWLNDVYEALGYKKTLAGQRVGWVYDPSSDDHGDNYIDLRIEEVYRECSDRPGSYEKVLIIDPNVDGNIERHALACDLIEA